MRMLRNNLGDLRMEQTSRNPSQAWIVFQLVPEDRLLLEKPRICACCLHRDYKHKSCCTLGARTTQHMSVKSAALVLGCPAREA